MYAHNILKRMVKSHPDTRLHHFLPAYMTAVLSKATWIGQQCCHSDGTNSPFSPKMSFLCSQGVWRCTHAKLAPQTPHPLARDGPTESAPEQGENNLWQATFLPHFSTATGVCRWCDYTLPLLDHRRGYYWLVDVSEVDKPGSSSSSDQKIRDRHLYAMWKLCRTLKLCQMVAVCFPSYPTSFNTNRVRCAQ